MDLRRLDRDVMSAARAVEKHRIARDRGDVAEDPWLVHRPVARATLYADLARLEVPAYERELKDALLAWIAWLTITRVTEPAMEDLRERLHASDVDVTLERTHRMSWRAAWQEMIRAPHATHARACFSALASHGRRIAPHVHRVDETRREATSRLFGASTLLGLELDEKTVVAAQSFWSGTTDLARDVRGRATKGQPDAWPLALDALSMRRAPEGWPARLSANWLDDLFGAFVRGLRLDLRLPSLISPASFVRALGAFGSAFRVACSGTSALARPPRFDDAHRFASAFALLAATDVFHRRALGLAPGAARDQARVVAGALLLSMRLACATLLAVEGRIDPAHASPDDELPSGLVGAWPIPRDDEAARARGWLLGAALVIELRDRHDEDWWRNPRAWDDLRAGSISTRAIDATAGRAVAGVLETFAS